MTHPQAHLGRPPVPGVDASTPELRIARFRSRATSLVFSTVLLIAASASVGYFTGNLPAPLEDWMLWVAAALVVVFLVALPFLRWLSRTYTITTRRVIATSGLLSRRRVEIGHRRGYSMTTKRGPLQRLAGSGTLELSNGIDAPVVLKNIGAVGLVHEVLADQVEVSQILAHRDSHAMPVVPDEA